MSKFDGQSLHLYNIAWSLILMPILILENAFPKIKNGVFSESNENKGLKNSYKVLLPR